MEPMLPYVLHGPSNIPLLAKCFEKNATINTAVLYTSRIDNFLSARSRHIGTTERTAKATASSWTTTCNFQFSNCGSRLKKWSWVRPPIHSPHAEI